MKFHTQTHSKLSVEIKLLLTVKIFLNSNLLCYNNKHIHIDDDICYEVSFSARIDIRGFHLDIISNHVLLKAFSYKKRLVIVVLCCYVAI